VADFYRDIFGFGFSHRRFTVDQKSQ
jgi:hypothetical protein